MNLEERLEEQEKENTALKAKVQVLETANIQHEKNIASLEEKYQNEIAELKVFFEEKLKKQEEIIHTNKQKISEAEDGIMMAIHQMKILLPPENWHDLLAFVPRSQLGNLVPQIGDYQFTDILQSFLHDKVREITLGKMSFIPPRPDVSSDQTMVHVIPDTTTNMPDWPMPGNIKNFKEIVLNYIDASVLHFLEKFQENSLLTDVNMHIAFDYKLRTLDENILSRVLTKIAPFITSIDSIESRSLDIDLFKMAYNNDINFGHINESQLLLKEMMAKTRIIVTNWDFNGIPLPFLDKMDWCCFWLYTPMNDEKPRMLRLCDDVSDNDCDFFIERIKNDFEMADHAVSFFIYADIWYVNVEDISVDNVKTNEKLVIKKVDDDAGGMLLIWRYPLNAAKNLRQMRKRLLNGMERHLIEKLLCRRV